MLRRYPLMLLLACCHLACQADRGTMMASLASPDPKVRARAVQSLGQRRDPNDLGYLIGRVSDPDPQVRESVALALGWLDDRRAAEALAKLVSDSMVSVQLVAITSLAKQKGPRAHAELLQAYEQGDCAVRARVIEALAASGKEPVEAVRTESRSLWTRYSRSLSRGSSSERIAAAEELGSSGRPEAVERLATYLGAESAPLAVAAARGLGVSGAKEARAPLEAMLTEESVDLQVAGADALGKLGNPDAVEALARVVPQGGRAGMAAVEALKVLLPAASRHDTHADAKLVCAALLVEDQEVAAGLARVVHAATVPCDTRALIGRMALAGSAGQAALAVLIQLEMEPDPTVTRRLADLLRSGPPSSKALAARLIGRMRVKALQPNLERLFADAALQLQRGRKRWVVVAVDGGVVPESLFAEDAPDVEAAYAEAGLALVRILGPEGKDTAVVLAQDPAAAVRERAAEATVALPSSEGWPLLRLLLDDSNLGVRDRALEALVAFDRGSPEPGIWLLQALSQADGRTDQSALIALLAKRPPTAGAVGVLAAALLRPDTAGAAAAALAHQDPTLAAPALVARLSERPTAGLIELIASVSAMQLKATVPDLRALRFCPRPEVAAAAATALWKLDAERAQAELAIQSEDYYLEVRRAAAGSPPG